MFQCHLDAIPNAAVLSIVRRVNGSYESVTVFVPFVQKENATCWNSTFGPVDIVYSWRSTYKMLNRKKSGFYTGTPLKTEQFIITTKQIALEQANTLFARFGKKVRKVSLIVPLIGISNRSE